MEIGDYVTRIKEAHVGMKKDDVSIITEIFKTEVCLKDYKGGREAKHAKYNLRLSTPEEIAKYHEKHQIIHTVNIFN